MEKSIIKIGSSLAIIIPGHVAKAAGLRQGQHVVVQEYEEGIMIRRKGRVAPVDLRGRAASVGFRLSDQRRARRVMSKQFARRWKNI